MKKTIPMEELCIDIGLSQEQATAVVPIGTPVVFRETAQPLGTDYISGKSMDDRACFTILLRTLELLQEEALDVDLYVMGSTREEVGGAGATVGTYGINPDYCVAVDVTHGATPDGPKDGTFALGSGPAIGMGPNMTRWMTNRMMDKAKANEIPFEIEVMSGHTGTNGWHMQTVREGIATSVISLPLRYMHTPVETLNVDDMEQVAKLLAAFTRDLGKEVGQR